MDERQNKIEKEQVGYQQELGVLKAQYKAENEKNMAEHTAELKRKAAEHKAEIEKIEARHEKETKEILYQVRLREIELDDKRKHLQRRENEFFKAIDAISATFSSGHPMNPSIIKTMTDLVAALREEVDNGSSPTPESKPSETEPPASSVGSDKVEKLTNTLLNLLNPKK
jgi:hypothetical protein